MKPRAGIDIGYVLLKIRCNWFYLLASIAMSLFLGIVILIVLPKAYKVTASVKVNDNSNNAIVENLFEGVKIVDESKNTSNEIAILKSFNLVKKTIDKLNFKVTYFQKGNLFKEEVFENLPFKVEIDTNVNQLINTEIIIQILDENRYLLSIHASDGQMFNYSNGGRLLSVVENIDFKKTVRFDEFFENEFLKIKLVKIRSAIGGEVFFFRLENTAALAEAYKKNLAIAPVTKEASILEINLVSPVPSKDIQFIDQLVQLYVEETSAGRNKMAQRTIDFINQQLLTISDSLKTAELGLQEFRTTNNVLDINYESKNVYDEQKTLEKQNADEKIKLKYYNYLKDYIEKSDDELDKIMAPSVVGIQDPTLNELITSLASYAAQKTNLNYSAREKNPKYSMLKENIAQTKAAILENVNNIRMSSQIKLQDIEKRLEKVRGEIAALPETERVLLSAQRKFDFSDNIYKYFLEKQGEAAILKESYTPADVIIDKARIEGTEPVSPNKKLILGLFLVLGLIVPLAIIFLKDIIDNKIICIEDIYRSNNTMVSVIQEIPTSAKKSNRNGYALDASIQEAFRALRLKVEKSSGTKIIAFTSLIEGDGKSFCLNHLAISMSQAGYNVLLVNLPSKQENTSGKVSSNVNKNMAQWDESEHMFKVGKSTTGGVYHFAFGSEPYDERIFRNGTLKHLFKVAMQEFHYVLIDCPAITQSANFLAIESITHLNLLVVRKNHTPSDLSQFNDLITADNSKYRFVFNG